MKEKAIANKKILVQIEKTWVKMEERTVLFVDDEEQILKSLKRSLIDEPYNTLFAHNVKDAFDILAKNDVHVIVTDMRMPETSGLELLKIVKDKYPYIIRIVLSGYAETGTLISAINQGEIYRYITKPWSSNGKFRTIIRQAIEFYNLHTEREMLTHFFELWMEGIEPETIDIELLQELISTRNEHLYEWKKKCDSVPLNVRLSQK